MEVRSGRSASHADESDGLAALHPITDMDHDLREMEKGAVAERPRLALLMKGHVDRALDLDPSFDEAHLALAMWYLQSPELAAKSMEKVKEILATLERMNSPLGEVLRKRLVERGAERL